MFGLLWTVCAFGSVAAQGEVPAADPRPPDKTVVLTFDDAVKSHLTFVVPLLKECRFGATFCISQAWMPDTTHFLTWEEVAQIDRMGFEIGNHTWNHLALHEAAAGQLVGEQFGRLEQALRHVGVPRPVSFSWPGNHFGPEALAAVRARGYLFGRRGPQPGGSPEPVAGMGPLYDPRVNDPLLIPTSGLAVPTWTLDDFKQVVDRARDGRIAVLQFHGVPDHAHPSCSTPPERFRSFMAYLKDGGFHVIALRDLADYVDQGNRPDDPLTAQRFYR